MIYYEQISFNLLPFSTFPEANEICLQISLIEAIYKGQTCYKIHYIQVTINNRFFIKANKQSDFNKWLISISMFNLTLKNLNWTIFFMKHQQNIRKKTVHLKEN